MFKAILLVGTGGFAGSVLRYVLSLWLNPLHAAGFPWGTFLVNIAGSFLIGWVMGWSFRGALGPDARLLLATGVCGGFTTFSSFSYEAWALLQNGEPWTAAFYAGGSMLLGLMAAAAGLWMAGAGS